MNSSMPTAWILILPMLLIVLGALAAIIWRSWIVGGIVLVIFVMVFGLYFVRSSAQVAAPATVNFREEPATPSPRLEIDPETLKNADVYPSPEEAAKNLALRFCENSELNNPPVSPERIHIVTTQDGRPAEIVKSVFSDRFRRADVKLDHIHISEPGEMMVVLGITESGQKTKCLKLTARLDKRDFTPLEVYAKDALWASNLDEYRADHLKGEWIVGWSSALDTTSEGALRQARQDAARQMREYVLAKFPQLNQPGLDQLIRNRLESDLFRHKYASEEFVQPLHLPATAERVYRAAVLADVSSQQLQRVQTTILPEVHRQSDSVRHFSLGTVGLGVVICAVYLFLNWATRGYFQMNLRLGAFLVLIAGVLMLLMIA